jgi:hypothetical protein
MLKLLRKLFGLCEHDYKFCCNIIMPDGPEVAEQCQKCLKLRYRKWNR